MLGSPVDSEDSFAPAKSLSKARQIVNEKNSKLDRAPLY
jgi:hypothetical protein